MIRTNPASAEFLIDEIRSGVIYSYARYGDGEFRSIQGWRGNNANEHNWTPELQEDLTNALLSRPKYRLATVIRFADIDSHSLAARGGLDTYRIAWEWLDKNNLDFEWYDQEVWADSLLAATKNGQVMPLLQFLREPGCPRVVLVGPINLKRLRNLFNVAEHVVIPPMDCHVHKQSIEKSIQQSVIQANEPTLCLISASMAAEVFIHDLYDTLGWTNWLIDIGSVWDPFLGRTGTRTYWQRMGAPVT